jgi:ribosome-binding ATPase
MNLSCGIVGLPNVGKSTLFNALLSRQVADAQNYPFCTIEPNTGVVEVPDSRLKELAKTSQSKKIVPSAIKFVDIAGLVKGASKGEGLGNKFLSHIREVNLIIHILRAFEDEDIARAGSEGPDADYEIITTELCLADLATLEKQREPKGIVEKEIKARWEVVKKIRIELEKGVPIRDINLSKEEVVLINDLNFITLKKEIVVLNVSEDDLSRKDEIRKKYEKWDPIVVSAKVEEDLIGLSGTEKKEYLKEIGIDNSGLEKLIKKSHETLGLIDFLTTGEMETRAWTIKAGTPAKEAAEAIHSDISDGFIRAAVTSVEEYVSNSGWKTLREKGKVRFEGKEYEVKDGDVIEFFHN